MNKPVLTDERRQSSGADEIDLSSVSLSGIGDLKEAQEVIIPASGSFNICIEQTRLDLSRGSRQSISLYPGDRVDWTDGKSGIFLGTSEQETFVHVANLEDGKLELAEPASTDTFISDFGQKYRVSPADAPQFFNKELACTHKLARLEWSELPEGTRIISSYIDSTGKSAPLVEELLMVEPSEHPNTAMVTTLKYFPETEEVSLARSSRQDFELKSAQRVELPKQYLDASYEKSFNSADIHLNESMLVKISNWAPHSDCVIRFTGSSGNSSPDEVGQTREILAEGIPDNLNVLAVGGNTRMFVQLHDGHKLPKETTQDLAVELGNKENVTFVGVTVTDPNPGTVLDAGQEVPVLSRYSVKQEGRVIGADITVDRAETPDSHKILYELESADPDRVPSNAKWLAEMQLSNKIAGVLHQKHGYPPPILVVAGGGSTTKEEVDLYRAMDLPVIFVQAEFKRESDVALTVVDKFANELGRTIPMRENDYVVSSSQELHEVLTEITEAREPGVQKAASAKISYGALQTSNGKMLQPGDRLGEVGDDVMMYLGYTETDSGPVVHCLQNTGEGEVEQKIIALDDLETLNRNVSSRFLGGQLQEVELPEHSRWVDLEPGAILLGSERVEVLSVKDLHTTTGASLLQTLEQDSDGALHFQDWHIRFDSELKTDNLKLLMPVKQSESLQFTEISLSDEAERNLESIAGIDDGFNLRVITDLLNTDGKLDEALSLLEKNIGQYEGVVFLDGLQTFRVEQDGVVSNMSTSFESFNFSSDTLHSVLVVPERNDSDLDPPLGEYSFYDSQGKQTHEKLFLTAKRGSAGRYISADFDSHAAAEPFEALAGASLKGQHFLSEKFLYQQPTLVVVGGGRTARKEIEAYRAADLPVVYLETGSQGTSDRFIDSFNKGTIARRVNDYVVRSEVDLRFALDSIKHTHEQDFRQNHSQTERVDNPQLVRPGASVRHLLNRSEADAVQKLAMSHSGFSLQEKTYFLAEYCQLSRQVGMASLTLSRYLTPEDNARLLEFQPEKGNSAQQAADHVRAVAKLASAREFEDKGRNVRIALDLADKLESEFKYFEQMTPTVTGVVKKLDPTTRNVKELSKLIEPYQLDPTDPRVASSGFAFKTNPGDLVSQLEMGSEVYIHETDDGRSSGLVVMWPPEVYGAIRPGVTEDYGRNKVALCYFLGSDGTGGMPVYNSLYQAGMLNMVRSGAERVAFFVYDNNEKGLRVHTQIPGAHLMAANRFEFRNKLNPDTEMPHYDLVVDLFGEDESTKRFPQGNQRRAELREEVGNLLDGNYPGLQPVDDGQRAQSMQRLEEQLHTKYEYMKQVAKLLDSDFSLRNEESWSDHMPKIAQLLGEEHFDDFDDRLKDRDIEGARGVLKTWLPGASFAKSIVTRLEMKFPEWKEERMQAE